jgi:tripartite-type tricarboxylate transporter receptor subunit TctC
MLKSTLIPAACLTLLVAGASAYAASPEKPADYPNRPINIVVAYPPGGGIDLTARTLATQMERITGLQFRVENRPGGGTVVGNTYLAKQAKPDGYTLGLVSNPTMSITIVDQGAPFTKDDIQPIGGITFAPVVWLSNTESKIGKMDFNQIIAYAKAHPGELKVGVIPNGAFDIATRILAKQKGVEFTIVPFQGGKPAAVALLGEHIDLAANYYDEVAQYIDTGKMKALAISDDTPMPQLPGVPTMKDIGVKMAAATWGADRFVGINANVSEEIKTYLADMIEKTLKDEDTRKAFEKVGIVLIPQTAKQEKALYDEAYSAVSEYFAEAHAAAKK